jgi:hypothetical protein
MFTYITMLVYLSLVTQHTTYFVISLSWDSCRQHVGGWLIMGSKQYVMFALRVDILEIRPSIWSGRLAMLFRYQLVLIHRKTHYDLAWLQDIRTRIKYLKALRSSKYKEVLKVEFVRNWCVGEALLHGGDFSHFQWRLTSWLTLCILGRELE